MGAGGREDLERRRPGRQSIEAPLFAVGQVHLANLGHDEIVEEVLSSRGRWISAGQPAGLEVEPEEGGPARGVSAGSVALGAAEPQRPPRRVDLHSERLPEPVLPGADEVPGLPVGADRDDFALVQAADVERPSPGIPGRAFRNQVGFGNREGDPAAGHGLRVLRDPRQEPLKARQLSLGALEGGLGPGAGAESTWDRLFERGQRVSRDGRRAPRPGRARRGGPGSRGTERAAAERCVAASAAFPSWSAVQAPLPGGVGILGAGAGCWAASAAARVRRKGQSRGRASRLAGERPAR